MALLAFGCSGMEPSCGKERTGDKSGVIDAENPKNDGNVVNDAGGSAASLNAFKETLHPILKEHCGACHGTTQAPKFAVDDADAAFHIITDAQLANASAIPASRLVIRLTQLSHNCWSECELDGKTMEDGIRAWFSKAGDEEGGGDDFIKLGEVAISSAKDFKLKGGTNGNWVVAAAHPDGQGARLAPRDELTASQRMVLNRSDAYLADNTVEGGAVYLLQIPDAEADYQLWFRQKNLQGPGSGNRSFARLNGASLPAIEPYNNDTNQNIGQRFVWVPAFYTSDDMGVRTPVARKLKPMTGLGKLFLEVADAEASIDMIALTKNATLDQTVGVNAGTRHGWTYDLTGLLGIKATLSLQYSETPDGHGYIFSRPTIETEETVKIAVQEMYVLVNGEFNKQLSTFASVDATITGSSELSHGDLIVPMNDKAKDTIDIAFKKLVVIP
jgi:hypothetical protein